MKYVGKTLFLSMMCTYIRLDCQEGNLIVLKIMLRPIKYNFIIIANARIINDYVGILFIFFKCHFTH
jgi:hypothetical protein